MNALRSWKGGNDWGIGKGIPWREVLGRPLPPMFRTNTAWRRVAPSGPGSVRQTQLSRDWGTRAAASRRWSGAGAVVGGGAVVEGAVAMTAAGTVEVDAVVVVVVVAQSSRTTSACGDAVHPAVASITAASAAPARS